MTDALPFAPGDKVHKATGSYKHNGIVRAVYPLGDGSLRVTVEHDADVEGTFVHHYAPDALAPGWLLPRKVPLLLPLLPLRRVQHFKRKSTYQVLGEAELQTSAPVGQGAKLIFYRSEVDGYLSARPTSEFVDGRFTEVLADD